MWNLQNVVCVCRLSPVGGVFIGPWGSSIDLVVVVTRHVAANRPSHVADQPMSLASTDVLHYQSFSLLV
jgi:hypothetical protein